MTTVAELQTHLQLELGHCRRLLIVLKVTRQTLTANDPTPLESCLSQQATLSQALADAEAGRQATLDALATLNGLPAGATLHDLLGVLPAAEATPLAALATEMHGVIGEIQRVQRTNQALLERALDWVDFNMELVADLERQTTVTPTYAPSLAGASAYSDGPTSSVLNLNA